MSDYKLTYFNGRARAELTRLIFAVAGQKYKDERFQWGDNSYKPNSPLGQLPYLTVDGVKIPQSIAIARFAAKKANLYGIDDLEQAKTDAVIDTLSDVQNIYYKKVFNGKPEDRDANVKSFLTDDAPTHLGNLEKLIKLWGSNGYSVGSSLKWSDLQIYAVTYELKTLDSNLLAKYPAIEAVVKSVEANPKVAEYLKIRPDAAF